ncbi:response regulator transcription factor [Kitasatospora sp. NPDC101235]|uniref:response regulator transcription factor n=1 Tax=Kitasatospora sp. NPDC101235 TaxID=3364101 RepID=UPI003809F062
MDGDPLDQIGGPLDIRAVVAGIRPEAKDRFLLLRRRPSPATPPWRRWCSSNSWRRPVAAAARKPPGPAALTAREADVLRLMAQGLSNGAIGRRLVIGESTVKTHVNHLFAKIGTRTRAEAVAWAHQNGYGEPS